MSNHVFATLTPANALARLAFHDVCESLKFRGQTDQAEGSQAALHRMHVKPEQKCDDEIVQLRREMRRIKYDTDGEASETLTEPDTDNEEQLQELGRVWTGSYRLGLDLPPTVPERGWAAGKGPLENMPIDLILCTRAFAKEYDLNLRNPHARFNFVPLRAEFYIIGCSRSSLAQLMVNGDAVARQQYHLNQHSMIVQVSKLEYRFEWTAFAAQDDFKEARRRYIAAALGGPSAAYVDFEMPTPVPAKRTMGRWTLGDALGAGGQGRVFFASDPSGNLAAIKVLERTSKNEVSVQKEIRTLKQITSFAQKADEDERVLRMAEVIYTRHEEFSSSAGFDNVAIVLQPMTPQTFVDLIGDRSKG